MKYKLEELFDLQMGKTPSRSNPDYWNTEDNKWISIGDLSQAGKYICETKEYISNSAVDESGIKVIPANTVIMSFKLSIGKTAITSEDMYSNEAIMAFHDKHVVELIPEYIYYMFKYKNWDEGTNKAVLGKTLNKATLSKVEIEVCDIEQQKEIVKVLEKVSTILEYRNTQILSLDDLIKSQFIEMFGDPLSNNKKQLHIKLVDCVKEKNDLVDGPFGSSVNTKVDYITDGEIPVIRTKNVNMMSFNNDDLKFMTRAKYETVIRSQVLPGDVILTKVGTIGNVCIFPNDYKEAVLSTTGSCRIRINEDKINKVFFAYYLVYYRKKLLEIASAGVQPFLNMNHIKNLDVFDVEIELQNQFASFVQIIEKQKFKVQQSLNETQLLFDSLMQQYFG